MNAPSRLPLLPFRSGNALEPLLECAPSDVAADVAAVAREEALRLMKAHGPASFIEPRETAAAHEAAHCVVDAAIGNRPVVCKVMQDRRSLGWGGFSGNDAGQWTITPDTDPAADMRQVMRFLAGFHGEIVVGLYRDTSSLDERLAGQFVGEQIAYKLVEGTAVSAHLTAVRLLQLASRDVYRILKENSSAHAELTAYLMRRRIARPETLDRILASVERATLTDPRVVLEVQPTR